MSAQASYYAPAIITHSDVLAFAKAKVNLPREDVNDRRRQTDRLI